MRNLNNFSSSFKLKSDFSPHELLKRNCDHDFPQLFKNAANFLCRMLKALGLLPSIFVPTRY